MGSTILWSATIGFVAGVFARSIWPFGYGVMLLLALCAGAVFCASLMRRSFRQNAYVIVLTLLFCALGMWRMHAAVLMPDAVVDAQIGKRVTVTGYVFAEPDARETSTHISLQARALTLGSSTIPVHAGMLATLPTHTHVSYGDEVAVSGTVRVPERFETGAGRTFDYPGYLAVSGVSYRLTTARIESIDGNTGNFAYAQVIGVKNAYLNGLHRVLGEPQGGLAGGITVGDKRSIGPELSDLFQRASLVHVLVLSGYNITLVINIVGYMVAILPRIIQFGISGAVVAFFIALSGGASSAVRAGIMALIAVYARHHARTYLPLRAIAVVAAGMALWNPYIIAFDPGFQLSALATVGLVAFTPLYAARLSWVTERFGVREIIASTLGTQSAVLPLILYQSGQLSIVALPANILALVAVPFAMFASFGAACAGILFGSVGVVLAFPAHVLLSYIVVVARFFGSLPYASVSVGAFSAWWLLLVYGLLAMVIWRTYEKTAAS